MAWQGHDPECEARLRREDAERTAWELRWPNHCRSCHGRGGTVFHEAHPYGMGFAYEQLFDPCPDCAMDNRCARCGVQYDTDDDGFNPCLNCGWNWGNSNDDVCPESECFCGWSGPVKTKTPAEIERAMGWFRYQVVALNDNTAVACAKLLLEYSKWLLDQPNYFAEYLKKGLEAGETFDAKTDPSRN